MAKRIDQQLAGKINKRFEKEGIGLDVLRTKSLRVFFNSGITERIKGLIHLLTEIGITENVIPIALLIWNHHLNGANPWITAKKSIDKDGKITFHNYPDKVTITVKTIKKSTIQRWARAVQIIEEMKLNECK